MTIAEPRRSPTLQQLKTISTNEDDDRPAAPLEQMEQQWIHDFIKRLSATIKDIGREK